MGNNHSQFNKKRKSEDTWNFDIDIDDENDIDIVASFIEENPFLFTDEIYQCGNISITKRRDTQL